MEAEKMDGAAEAEPEEPQDVQEGAASADNGARRRKKAVAVAACALMLVAAVGVGIAVAANRPAPVEAGAPAASQTQERQTGAEKAVESAVTVTVQAEGADAGATKAKVVATGSDGKAVVPETEIEANKASVIGRLPKGGYELHVTAAPVCADGSSYKLPEKPVAFKVGGLGADVKLDVELERIAAEDMTKEQLEAAAKILAENGNAEASEAVQSKSEAAPSVPGSDSAVKHDPVPTPAPDNGGSSGGSGSNNPGSPNSGGGSNTPSNPANPPAPEPTPTPNPPAHGHSWTPVTEQRWVSNVVTITDVPAYDEQVKQGSYVLCSCGWTCNAAGDWSAHNMENGGTHSYSVVPNFITVHHDAVTHTEDRGYNETITTGYTCSCGATK